MSEGDSELVRNDADAFDALRDGAAARFGVDAGAVEKEYWAMEVLRSATTPLDGVREFVVKGAQVFRRRLESSNGFLKTSTCSSSATRRVNR